MGGEPAAALRLHMGHEAPQDPDPAAVPDDVGMHGQDIKAVLLPGAVELCFEDLLDSRGGV